MISIAMFYDARISRRLSLNYQKLQKEEMYAMNKNFIMLRRSVILLSSLIFILQIGTVKLLLNASASTTSGNLIFTVDQTLSADRYTSTVTIDVKPNPGVSGIIIKKLPEITWTGVESATVVENGFGGYTATYVFNSKASGSKNIPLEYTLNGISQYDYYNVGARFTISDQIVPRPALLSTSFDSENQTLNFTYKNLANLSSDNMVQGVLVGSNTFTDIQSVSFDSSGNATLKPTEDYYAYRIYVLESGSPIASDYVSVYPVKYYTNSALSESVTVFVGNVNVNTILPTLPAPSGSSFNGWLLIIGTTRNYMVVPSNAMPTSASLDGFQFYPYFKHNITFSVEGGSPTILTTAISGTNIATINTNEIPTHPDKTKTYNWRAPNGDIWTTDDFANSSFDGAMTFTAVEAQLPDPMEIVAKKVYDQSPITQEIIKEAYESKNGSGTWALHNVSVEDFSDIINVTWADKSSQFSGVITDSQIGSQSVNYTRTVDGTVESGTVKVKIYPRLIHVTAGSAMSIHGSNHIFTQSAYLGHGYLMNQVPGNWVGYLSSSLAEWYSANNKSYLPSTPILALSDYTVVGDGWYAHKDIKLLPRSVGEQTIYTLSEGQHGDMHLNYGDLELNNYAVRANFNAMTVLPLGDFTDSKLYDGKGYTLTSHDMMEHLSGYISSITKTMQNMGDTKELKLMFWNDETKSFSDDTHITDPNVGTHTVQFKLLAEGESGSSTTDKTNAYTAIITITASSTAPTDPQDPNPDPDSSDAESSNPSGSGASGSASTASGNPASSGSGVEDQENVEADEVPKVEVDSEDVELKPDCGYIVDQEVLDVLKDGVYVLEYTDENGDVYRTTAVIEGGIVVSCCVLERAGSWSLFDLLSTIAAAVLAIGFIVLGRRRSEDDPQEDNFANELEADEFAPEEETIQQDMSEQALVTDENELTEREIVQAKRTRRHKIIALLLEAVILIILLFITQDFTLPMTIFDRFSIIFGLSVVLSVVTVYISKRKKDNSDNDDIDTEYQP